MEPERAFVACDPCLTISIGQFKAEITVFLAINDLCTGLKFVKNEIFEEFSFSKIQISTKHGLKF
jgi:hypothetical protein